MIDDIKEYAFKLHDIDCNQKYDKTSPYSFHLQQVFNQGMKFKHLVDGGNQTTVLAGCYLHDSIEDARVTYNDLKLRFSVDLAEIVYLCTENKGRNRSDRKNDVFYNELKTNKLAIFVKLCDLIANVKYSFLTNSTMFNKYKTEYNQKVKPMLYLEEFKPIFDYLDKIFEIE